MGQRFLRAVVRERLLLAGWKNLKTKGLLVNCYLTLSLGELNY